MYPGFTWFPFKDLSKFVIECECIDAFTVITLHWCNDLALKVYSMQNTVLQNKHVFIYTHAHTYTHILTRTYTLTYSHTHTLTHTHTLHIPHTYTHHTPHNTHHHTTHTHTHAHTHTHTCTLTHTHIMHSHTPHIPHTPHHTQPHTTHTHTYTHTYCTEWEDVMSLCCRVWSSRHPQVLVWLRPLRRTWYSACQGQYTWRQSLNCVQCCQHSIQESVLDTPTLLHLAALNNCTEVVDFLKQRLFPPIGRYRLVLDYNAPVGHSAVGCGEGVVRV